MNEKMYILVRKDLPERWQTAQACHAAVQYMIDNENYPNTVDDYWDNETMVILGVKDLDELQYWFDRCVKLKLQNRKPSLFKEQHLNNEPTGFAIVGKKQVSDLFKTLDLL